MENLASYSLDDLTRMLTIGRWAFGILAVCTIVTGIFTQWASSKLLDLHREEREKLREHLLASQSELRRVSKHSSDLVDDMDRLTASRQITAAQSTTLREALQNGPRGKVIVTFLSVEWDAERYARQIANLLITAGFEVTVSEHLWVHLDHDGLFFCLRDSEELPAKSPAAHIQRCFAIARVEMAPVVKSPMIREAVAAPDDAVVLVVSNRK